MGENFSIHIDRITEEMVAAIPAAAFKGMEHLRQVAVSKTPLELGDLRSSASVEPIPAGALVIYRSVYARYQHYRLDLRHEVGQALYLEQPPVQETEKILEIVATDLRRVLD